MRFDCKCMECENSINVLFDFRYLGEQKIELYVIADDGRYPKPTGYCVECLKDAIGQDLDMIVSNYFFYKPLTTSSAGLSRIG